MTTLFPILGRMLVAWVFLRNSIDTFRRPEPRAGTARWLLDSVREMVPAVPSDDVLLVKANAGLQVAAASMLALGRPPRLPALMLLLSMVPTTIGGHPFWRHSDPAARSQQRIHFDKNLAIIGALFLLAFESPRRRTHA